MPTPPIPTSLPPGALHLTYKSCSTWPFSSHTGSSSDSPIHISILDSSFNPPTLAHLAIASSDPPPASSASSPSSPPSPLPYTARLLLFSLRNVDKKPQPSDPSLEQRLSMVHLLAQRIPDLPIAVGILDEPTFAGKSHVIHNFLKTSTTTTTATGTTTTATATGTTTTSTTSPTGTTSIGDRSVRLSFLIGTDTLTRFFEPRYYVSDDGGMHGALGRFFNEPPEGQGSRIVSARRGNSDEDRAAELGVLEKDEAKIWVQQGKLSLLGNGDEEWVGMSSTKVRAAVKRGDVSEVKRLVSPEIAEYIQREGLYL